MGSARRRHFVEERIARRRQFHAMSAQAFNDGAVSPRGPTAKLLRVRTAGGPQRAFRHCSAWRPTVGWSAWTLRIFRSWDFSKCRSRRHHAGYACRRQLVAMGRETLDQATFARLHTVTKPLQVLTTLHANSETRLRRRQARHAFRRQLTAMGRKTLDQATFARLHSITKPLQVLATLHAKSRGAIPWHSLRRGRLGYRRSPRQRIVGLSKGPWPHEQQHCSDEKRTSHVARHFDSSIALRHPRAASRRSNPLKETKLAAFNRWKRDQPARFRQRRLKSYDGSPHGTALRRFPR